MSTGFILGICLVTSIVSLGAVILAGWALIEVRAFQRSTHRIEYIPAPTKDEIAEMDRNSAELNKAIDQSMGDFYDGRSRMPMMDENM